MEQTMKKEQTVVEKLLSDDYNTYLSALQALSKEKVKVWYDAMDAVLAEVRKSTDVEKHHSRMTKWKLGHFIVAEVVVNKQTTRYMQVAIKKGDVTEYFNIGNLRPNTWSMLIRCRMQRIYICERLKKKV